MAKKTDTTKAPARLKREAKAVPPEVAVDTAKDTETVIPPKMESTKPDIDDADKEEEDYLRQYQYKKVNNIPTVGGVLTDPEAGSKAARMKVYLLSEEKVSILIPLPEGSDPKVLYSVCLNGYRLDFPTNAYIKVPMQIATVISDSNKQTLMALEQGKVGGNKKKEDALG